MLRKYDSKDVDEYSTDTFLFCMMIIQNNEYKSILPNSE